MKEDVLISLHKYPGLTLTEEVIWLRNTVKSLIEHNKHLLFELGVFQSDNDRLSFENSELKLNNLPSILLKSENDKLKKQIDILGLRYNTLNTKFSNLKFKSQNKK